MLGPRKSMFLSDQQTRRTVCECLMCQPCGQEAVIIATFTWPLQMPIADGLCTAPDQICKTRTDPVSLLFRVIDTGASASVKSCESLCLTGRCGAVTLEQVTQDSKVKSENIDHSSSLFRFRFSGRAGFPQSRMIHQRAL